MDIKTIGVIGAGQMGSGITQVAAASGFSVIMNDIKDEFVERGFSAIEKSLGRMVKKEKISQEDQKHLAEKVYVSTGVTVQDATSITGGLSGGDLIIVKGYNQVSDGEAVSVMQ